MKILHVRHSEAQHIKIDELVELLGVTKSQVVQAALSFGLKEICRHISEKPDVAATLVMLESIKAR